MHTTDFFQKFEVLHIARADLDDVHVAEKVDVANAHNFGNDRHTRLLLRFEKKFDPFVAKSLERIRRSAGFERAAAKHGCARRFNRFSHFDDLLFGFDRARTRDRLKVLASELMSADFDDSVLGVEFAVYALVRLLNTLYRIYDVERTHEVHIYFGRVSDKS